MRPLPCRPARRRRSQPLVREVIAPVRVRAAHAGEADALARISTGHIRGKRTFIADSLAARVVRVADIDAAAAGYIIWDRGFFGRPFVWLLGVDPAFRRRGIAGRLLDAFESAWPGETLFTSTNESNIVMQELLTARGYVYSGRVDHLDPGDPERFYCKPAVP
jgi:ribosomal protein S18 acetylase RimI-like enzyme